MVANLCGTSASSPSTPRHHLPESGWVLTSNRPDPKPRTLEGLQDSFGKIGPTTPIPTPMSSSTGSSRPPTHRPLVDCPESSYRRSEGWCVRHSFGRSVPLLEGGTEGGWTDVVFDPMEDLGGFVSSSFVWSPGPEVKKVKPSCSTQYPHPLCAQSFTGVGLGLTVYVSVTTVEGTGRPS